MNSIYSPKKKFQPQYSPKRPGVFLDRILVAVIVVCGASLLWMLLAALSR